MALKPAPSGALHQRGIAFAKYADLLWWKPRPRTSKRQRNFADAVHKVYPNKMLA